MRFKHYRIRTEQTYSDWIERFIRFHHKRHPREMAEVEAFLTSDAGARLRGGPSPQQTTLGPRMP
jgi:Phage integrase, N-terminal SAM-like domain